jgi:hypothetical protein
MVRGLLQRIFAETGLVVSKPEDQHILAGMFNRYRPNGDGVERILEGDGVEGAVRARVMRIFEATARAGKSGDLYFVVRQPEPMDPQMAVQYASDYLNGIGRLADFVNDSKTRELVASLIVSPHPNTPFARDERVAAHIWECVGDFLAKFQPDRDELFILKEALYSMANDLVLTAYVLWPAVQRSVSLPELLDPYFNLWRHRIGLDFSTDGHAYVKPKTDLPRR